MVTIKDKVTARTMENSLIKGDLLPMSTSGAILAGVARVHGDIPATSVFSFVRKIGGELPPCYVHDGLSQTMIIKLELKRGYQSADFCLW